MTESINAAGITLSSKLECLPAYCINSWPDMGGNPLALILPYQCESSMVASTPSPL